MYFRIEKIIFVNQKAIIAAVIITAVIIAKVIVTTVRIKLIILLEMEYYTVEKKTAPYVNDGFWCIDIIVSSSETGNLYRDRVFGRRVELLNIKKGDVHTPKSGKILEKVD